MDEGDFIVKEDYVMSKPKPLDKNWTMEDLRRWVEEFIRWKRDVNVP